MIPLTAHVTPGPKTVYDIPPAPLPPDAAIRLQPINPGTNVPDAVTVTMTFPTSIGTVTSTVANVPWDGTAYTISGPQLTAFVTDLIGLLSSNNLLPAPPPPSSFLTTKSISVQPVPKGGVSFAPSTTVNQLNINLQANVVQGKTSALTPPSPATTVSLSSPLTPATKDRTGDPTTRKVGFEAAAPAALAITGQVPAIPHVDGSTMPTPTLPDPILQLPSHVQSLSDKTSALSERTAALSGQVSAALSRPAVPPHTFLVMPHGTPSVNVSVPITNMLNPAKHHGMFRRKAGTPQSPAKPSMLQRMMNP